MKTVNEAVDIVTSGVTLIGEEEVDLLNAQGRILRQDIVSDIDLPPFDNSAMDGYAVKSVDLQNIPVSLKVIEDIPAGYVGKEKVLAGLAVRIMTGAPVPEGADTVVMQEDTDRSNDSVTIKERIKTGKNIRKAGEDIKKDELVIKKGTKIKSAHLGLLASLGIVKVKVSKKPKIAILVTGDEVVDINSKLEPGKIRNSNGYALYGLTSMSLCEPVLLGIAKDNKEEIKNKILEGIKNDILIVSGGVSVGDYDMVHKALYELGMEKKIDTIAIKPGKPVVFGILQGKPVFGLPGNPVSSMVSFELFVKPVIYGMIGYDYNFIKNIEAVLEEDIKKKKGRRHFVRAVTKWRNGRYVARTTGPQGSGILKSMTIANSLIDVPEDIEKLEKGTSVKVRFWGH